MMLKINFIMESLKKITKTDNNNRIERDTLLHAFLLC